MEGPPLLPPDLDAGAESAVRVIGFFDALIAGRADLRTLVTETAALAGCGAGVTDPGRGVCERAGPGEPGRASAVRELTGTGRVWLERTGPPPPLDDLVLERFAIAAADLLHHPTAPPELGDAALVGLALSEDAAEAERIRALGFMHLGPSTPLRVLALDTDRAADVLAALGPPRPPAAELEGVHAVLAASLPEEFPRLKARIGIGPALPAVEAPASWRAARAALRFAGPASTPPAVVHADDLGALAAIAARLRPEDITGIADVTALDRIATEPNGHETLAALAAFCDTGSVRKAGTRVGRHHSTVAARLARAETTLGFSFATPTGRRRLDLALLLRHLRSTPTPPTLKAH